MVEYKQPDYIILDDTQDELNDAQTQKIVKAFKKARKNAQQPFSIIQRLIFLIAALFIGFWVSCIFWVLLFCLLMAGLALGRNETLNGHLQTVFSYFQKYLVTTLGLSIAVFSPALGLGLIDQYSIIKM